MASNNPIIATNIPAIGGIISDKKNALVVRSDSGKAIADAISDLINSKSLSNKISEQAWKDVQPYTWTNRAKKILEWAC